jgi:hypothetical protein
MVVTVVLVVALGSFLLLAAIALSSPPTMPR